MFIILMTSFSFKRREIIIDRPEVFVVLWVFLISVFFPNKGSKSMTEAKKQLANQKWLFVYNKDGLPESLFKANLFRGKFSVIKQ